MAILPTGFGKSLIAQLFVMMCRVRSKQQGLSSIIVTSLLQSIIQDQVVEVNCMEMTACDLNEKLNSLDDIHQGKFNIIYTSAEATMDMPFLNTLKSKDFLFNENTAACIEVKSEVGLIAALKSYLNLLLFTPHLAIGSLYLTEIN